MTIYTCNVTDSKLLCSIEDNISKKLNNFKEKL